MASNNLIDEVVRVRAVYEYGPDRVRCQAVEDGAEESRDLILPREDHPRVGDYLRIRVDTHPAPEA